MSFFLSNLVATLTRHIFQQECAVIILDEYWDDEDYNMSGYNSFMLTENKTEWLVWEVDKNPEFFIEIYIIQLCLWICIGIMSKKGLLSKLHRMPEIGD